MMALHTKPLVEINRQAFVALYRELGVVDAVRFLRQFIAGFGDYTAEREMLFGEASLTEIIAQIRQERASYDAFSKGEE